MGESQTSLTREVEIGHVHEGEFLCIATYLPIRNWRHVFPFLNLSRKVQNQLTNTVGVIRYSVKADFFHKKFWTFTVWSDRSYIEPFVKKNPHAEAISRFKDWAGAGAAFVEWTSKDGSIDWNMAYEKLQNPTFYYDKSKV